MPTTQPLLDELGSEEGQLKPIDRGTPLAGRENTPRPSAAAPQPRQTATVARPSAQIAAAPAPRPERPARRVVGSAAMPHLRATSAPAPSANSGSQPTPSPAPTRAPRHNTFTEEDLLRQWKAYIDANPTAVVVGNTMRTSPIKLLSATSFIVQVHNAAQIEGLTKARPSIVNFLRDRLANDDVTFEIIEYEGEASPRTWNDREVFAHMLSDNPVLQQLVDDFKMTLI